MCRVEIHVTNPQKLSYLLRAKKPQPEFINTITAGKDHVTLYANDVMKTIDWALEACAELCMIADVKVM